MCPARARAANHGRGVLRRKWQAVIGLVAAAGVGAAGGVSVAAPGGHGSARAHASTTDGPHARVAKSGTRVVTLEVDVSLPDNVATGSSGRCPARAPHAVSGYWGTDEDGRDGDLVNVRSSPVGTSGREWEVTLKNVSSSPISAYVGMVCVK